MILAVLLVVIGVAVIQLAMLGHMMDLKKEILEAVRDEGVASKRRDRVIVEGLQGATDITARYLLGNPGDAEAQRTARRLDAFRKARGDF